MIDNPYTTQFLTYDTWMSTKKDQMDMSDDEAEVLPKKTSAGSSSSSKDEKTATLSLAEAKLRALEFLLNESTKNEEDMKKAKGENFVVVCPLCDEEGAYRDPTKIPITDETEEVPVLCGKCEALANGAEWKKD